jgi:cytoskeletal protein CcmA (bactofilin family)
MRWVHFAGLRGTLVCVLLLACGAALPDDDRREVVTQKLGGDTFVAGGEVTVASPVEGDLLVTGGSVDVDAPVAGDVLAFGGQVRLNGDVAGSVVGAAGQTTIDGRVGRNLRLAGGRVELGPRSEIGGNVSVGTGQLRLRGSVRGQVLAGGGRLLIDGPVGGDVVVGGGEIELGPNARIAGQLRYRSGEPLRQDPQAQVAGGIERLARPGGQDSRFAGGRFMGAAAALAGLLWTLGLVAVAGLLIAAMPGFSGIVSRTLRERPGASLLLGFVVLVCVPVAAVLLFVTVIGVPLGLVALALYGALLPLAYVAGAVALGDWALLRWQPQRVGRAAARFVAAALVLLALALLGWIPLLGALTGLAVLLAGLGALLMQFGRGPAAGVGT